MLKKYCITAAVALPPRLAGQGSHFFKESHLRHVRRVSVAVRYVDGLLNVSPRLTVEAVHAGLLLLLLQLQGLDLRLELLQLILQVFALLHILQPFSLDLHGQPFHVRVLEVEASRC